MMHCGIFLGGILGLFSTPNIGKNMDGQEMDQFILKLILAAQIKQEVTPINGIGKRW